MAQPVGGDGFSKTVVLLKKEDCERRNGKVYMPNTIEMAKIRKPDRGQYRTNVQFSKIMGKDMVRRRLQEEFPTFDLMNVRFSCAAVSQDSIAFQFHGTPCVWDGRTIKRLIKGNSVLYIVMEYDQMNTTSGISASDPESSQDAAKMSPLLLWLKDNIHFDVECNPNYSPLQGGGPCVFTFTPRLQPEVTSVYATFEELGTQKLEYLKLGFFPASRQPQVVRVTLTSQDGIILGYTQVTYGTNLQQVVSYPSALKKLFEDLMSCDPSDNPSGNSGGEAESLIILGCKKPAQMLSLLVYVAAEIGAQQFIEIIFTSSARRVVHNAYKCNLTLPETIARDHGHIETANYLADVTKRFSEETSTDNECSQTIDWSELVKAAEVAEKQLNLTNEKQNGQVETNDPKETGYLADADTSSSEASAPQSSDSEDDISNKTKTTATAAAAAAVADTSSSEASAPQSSDSEDDISIKTKTTATAAATAKATAAATTTTTTTETRKGWVSGREYQIGPQKDLRREDRNADTGVPIAGNYRGRKETIPHQFESVNSGDTMDEILREARLEIMEMKLLLKRFITESDSSKTGKILQQGDVHRKAYSRDTEDSVADSYRDRKETLLDFESVNSGDTMDPLLRKLESLRSRIRDRISLQEDLPGKDYLEILRKLGESSLQGDLHGFLDANAEICHRHDMKILRQLESVSSKTRKIWQQGDVHRKAHSRDTEDSVADSYRDRKETLLDFEVEDILSTSDFMNDVKRIKDKLPGTIRFSDLSKAEKQEDRKELEKLKVKANAMIRKAKGTAKSLREAAGKLDEVWKSSKKAQAAGTIGSITGGLLTFAGGVATVITGGAAAPLLVAGGIGIGMTGAGANLLTSYMEASTNSSEIKKAEKMLKDTKDSIDDVSSTMDVWLESKDEVNLLYICCLAELDPAKNVLVMKLLEGVVLHGIMFSVCLGQTGKAALSAGLSLGNVAAHIATTAAFAGQSVRVGTKAAGQSVRVGTKAADQSVRVGTKAAGQVASKLVIGVTAALVLYDAIDLGYTIKDIVEDKGSEAARCLRQKADELECFLKSFKDQLPVNF